MYLEKYICFLNIYSLSLSLCVYLDIYVKIHMKDEMYLKGKNRIQFRIDQTLDSRLQE